MSSGPLGSPATTSRPPGPRADEETKPPGWMPPGGVWQAEERIDGLSARVPLPIFRSVAKLIFELLLRQPVGEHAIHPGGAGRIRLAAEHLQVSGSHDRLRLVTRVHRLVVSIRSIAGIIATVVTLVASVPLMVVGDIPAIAFPPAGEVLSVVVVGRDPIGARVRWPRPVAIMPLVVPSLGILIALDPLVVRAGLKWNTVRPRSGRLADMNAEGKLRLGR